MGAHEKYGWISSKSLIKISKYVKKFNFILL